jgi:hypothetical protein
MGLIPNKRALCSSKTLDGRWNGRLSREATEQPPHPGGLLHSAVTPGND